ncbi:heme-binding protein [Tissierella creatinini]|nr:heme-binding protein [Tissierella creatinini]TJX60117.1 heme-binding protein [Soehngenia saccharolytica]
MVYNTYHILRRFIKMAIEKAAYKVILKEDPFEIRNYEPMIIAVSQETDLRGSTGFNTLFNYISGANQESKKISMTSPVLNNLDEQTLTTAFIMPKEYDLENLPQPSNSNLHLKKIPKRQVAVIIFSGNIDSSKINQKKDQLKGWLIEKQLTPIGPIELARYNPPFIPGFLKRNELLIEIQPIRD